MPGFSWIELLRVETGLRQIDEVFTSRVKAAHEAVEAFNDAILFFQEAFSNFELMPRSLLQPGSLEIVFASHILTFRSDHSAGNSANDELQECDEDR